ncbi:glypican-6-like [Platysternon megacephalum]|uniref:Glypican-6-like n=1 Tax=Platysternon megacephalum TaxID=55544 RepID=A0A4D9EV79_9SAUR|nr:glypican-6-like [Platysternon megacephalum]
MKLFNFDKSILFDRKLVHLKKKRPALIVSLLFWITSFPFAYLNQSLKQNNLFNFTSTQKCVSLCSNTDKRPGPCPEELPNLFQTWLNDSGNRTEDTAGRTLLYLLSSSSTPPQRQA